MSADISGSGDGGLLAGPERWQVHELSTSMWTWPVGGGPAGAVRATVVVDPAEPWFIRLDLRGTDRVVVPWVLDRELLTEALALDAPAGDGDLRLEPLHLSDRDYLLITLYPGRANGLVLLADLPIAARALELSLQVCPPGAEPPVSDVELHELLSGGAP